MHKESPTSSARPFPDPSIYSDGFSVPAAGEHLGAPADGMTVALNEWRDTVDSVSDLIILEDTQGSLRRCNRATIEFFRCGFKDLIGKPLVDIFKCGEGLATAHLRDSTWEGRLDGVAGWFEISNNRVHSDGQDFGGWVHIIKGVTRRRMAEQEARKLYSVIEQSSDGILITDAAGSIEYVNEVFEKLLGTEAESLSGEAISEAFPDLTPERLDEEVFPHLEHNRIWRVTRKTNRVQDEIFEEITISKVIGTDGHTHNYVFVVRDVTETHQLQSIAEAVNLMENFGYVFSGIRHELGNPINSVKMALTVLEMNHKQWDHDQTDLFIARCLQELGRVEYLLRTLKSFSLHEQVLIEEADLNEFVGHFNSMIRPDFERRNVEIEIVPAAGIRPALCDPRALHQVMMNLVANAADALAERPDAKITIATAEARNRVGITVSDNGKGMSEKQMSNLFKPFYTSKPDGSGLGLVIVRKMMASMGGTIDIESQAGLGTKVHLSLPSASDANDSHEH